MRGVYYNEIDPFAVAWLRELIKAGHLPAGDVDDRPIESVGVADLVGYRQAHFFAGIGGWAYALRLADWSDDRPVWTGSCPCQPFSIAGQQRGVADARHLWPVWYRLIRESRPPVVFGEQVAGSGGRTWLTGVRTDLEGAGYAVGAADLCAAGAGAPHLRQRHYFVADAGGERRQQDARSASGDETPDGRARWNGGEPDGDHIAASAGQGNRTGMADTDRDHRFWWSGPLQVGRNAIEATVIRGGRSYRAQWRLGPGIRLVAYGIPNRVGALCGAGNAIVPHVAAAFIRAYQDTRTP